MSKIAFNWTKPNGKKLEKAEAFFWNPHPFSAMVGGIRNAKTTAACRRTIFLALAYPGNRGLMARYENTDLEKSTLLIFKEEIARLNGGKFAPGPIIKRINNTDNVITLYNGSEIYWAHLDKPEDVQGSEWGSVHIDELHEIHEDTFNQLKSRMTFWNPMRIAEFRADKERLKMQKEILGYNVLPTNYFYITQNPNPNWTKKRIKENVNNEFYVIESTTEDNKENLPPGWYEEQLRTMPKEFIDRFMMNDWDIAGGTIYKEFATSIHVIDEFPIPTHWERLRGLDFGLRNPTAVSWFAADEYGNLFIYDEHYQTGMLPEGHAEVIKAKSIIPGGGPIRYFNSYNTDGKDYLSMIADPSGQNRSIANEEKLFDEYLTYGISCTPGNNNFSFGYTRVSQYLHVDLEHIHPITKQKGSPRLFVFRNCVNTINEFIGYAWKDVPTSQDRDPDEKPKKVNDHLMDEIRYVVASRPEPSVLPKDEPAPTAYARMAQSAFILQEEAYE